MCSGSSTTSTAEAVAVAVIAGAVAVAVAVAAGRRHLLAMVALTTTARGVGEGQCLSPSRQSTAVHFGLHTRAEVETKLPRPVSIRVCCCSYHSVLCSHLCRNKLHVILRLRCYLLSKVYTITKRFTSCTYIPMRQNLQQCRFVC
jgi:hypothetical protein